MRAKPGDWLIVESSRVGERPRPAMIEEVRSEDGGPPYLIRWTDSGNEALMFPGPDSHVVTKEEHDRQGTEVTARALAVQAEIAARRRSRRA